MKTLCLCFFVFLESYFSFGYVYFDEKKPTHQGAYAPGIWDYRYYIPNLLSNGGPPYYQVNINQIPKEWLRGEKKPDLSNKKLLLKPSELTEIESNEVMDNEHKPMVQAVPFQEWNGPSKDPRCKSSRGQFPLKTSCSSFLNCWDWAGDEQECPGELLFSDAGFCDYPHRVHCNGRPIDQRRPGCHYPYNSYRNPNNCSEFFMCSFNWYYLFRCPDDLQYNEDLGVCDYPHQVNCEVQQPGFRLPSNQFFGEFERPLNLPGAIFENGDTNSLHNMQPAPSGNQFSQNVFPFYQTVWNVATSREDAMRQLRSLDPNDSQEFQINAGY